jgi:hypothetical protein
MQRVAYAAQYIDVYILVCNTLYIRAAYGWRPICGTYMYALYGRIFMPHMQRVAYAAQYIELYIPVCHTLHIHAAYGWRPICGTYINVYCAAFTMLIDDARHASTRSAVRHVETMSFGTADLRSGDLPYMRLLQVSDDQILVSTSIGHDQIKLSTL